MTKISKKINNRGVSPFYFKFIHHSHFQKHIHFFLFLVRKLIAFCSHDLNEKYLRIPELKQKVLDRLM